MPSVKEWNKERAKLKIEYEDRGITTCEIQLQGCWRNNGLSFAHKEKRRFYDKKENIKLLGSFSHTLLACVPCHQIIEGDRELTNELFNKLR